MRREPVNGWVNARALLPKRRETIIVSPHNPKGVTRHYLLEEVSVEAAAAGYKTGDMVVAQKVYDKFIPDHRVTFPIAEIIERCHDFSLDDFTDVAGKPVDTKENGAAPSHDVTGAPA